MRLKLFQKFFLAISVIVIFSISVMVVIFTFFLNQNLTDAKFESLEKCCEEISLCTSSADEANLQPSDLTKILSPISTVSGADIFIDHTEAMTVIDVNSGKKAGKEAPGQTYFAINKEAAGEICHQIVLRNLSGIILIDFINMKDDESRKELTGFMSELCKINDPKMHIIDITKLGIMETTRQKTGPSLFELFDS